MQPTTLTPPHSASKIIAYMEKINADPGHVKSVKNDRFNGHPFEKF